MSDEIEIYLCYLLGAMTVFAATVIYHIVLGQALRGAILGIVMAVTLVITQWKLFD